jgi:MFS family permease
MNKNSKSRLFTSSYIISFLIAILSFCTNSIFMTVIPLVLSQRMGASKSEIGTVLGFSSIGIIIVRPLLGYALDRWGRRKILFISLFFMPIISLCYFFAKTPAAIFLVRIFQIIPYAASTTALVTIASDIVPDDRRGEGISYFTTCSTLSLAIGPAVGIALFNTNWYGWPFIVSGILGITCFICSFLIKIPKINLVKIPLSLRSIFDKRVLLVASVGGIAFMGAAGMYSYSTLYAKEIGLKAGNVSLAFTLFAVSLLLTRVLTSKTMDKKGPKLSGALSLSLFSAGLGIMGLWRSLPGFLVGAFILGGGMGIILPTALSMAIGLVPPHRRGICNGLVYTCVDVGSSSGAFLFGVTADLFHKYSSSYILFAVIEFLAIFLFLFVISPYYFREKAKVDLLQAENS